MSLELESDSRVIYNYAHNIIDNDQIDIICHNILKILDLLIQYHKERILQFKQDYYSIDLKIVPNYIEDMAYVDSLNINRFDTNRFLEDYEFMTKCAEKLRSIDANLNKYREELDKEIGKNKRAVVKSCIRQLGLWISKRLGLS